jgi:hypothetical protein
MTTAYGFVEANAVKYPFGKEPKWQEIIGDINF